MNERINNYIQSLFADTPQTPRAMELKDELTANVTDRYNDLIAKGEDEETAFKAAIAGIGNTDALISELRSQEVLDPVSVQMQRQKSALLVSIAVALYIVSLVFPIMFGGMSGEIESTLGILGIVLMFICWAIATMLLVYNALSKPKYVKLDSTVVEEFKEWRMGKEKTDAVYKSVSSLIYMIATLLFLLAGFFLDAWHPAWLLFVLAPIINHIIKLVGVYKGDNNA